MWSGSPLSCSKSRSRVVVKALAGDQVQALVQGFAVDLATHEPHVFSHDPCLLTGPARSRSGAVRSWVA